MNNTIKALILLLLLLLFGCDSMEDKVVNAISNGNEIVQAIETYRMKNAKPPATLNELVPRYLPEIKSSGIGEGKWHYSVTNDGRIAFSSLGGSRNEPGIAYSFSKKIWHVDTK